MPADQRMHSSWIAVVVVVFSASPATLSLDAVLNSKSSSASSPGKVAKTRESSNAYTFSKSQGYVITVLASFFLAINILFCAGFFGIKGAWEDWRDSVLASWLIGVHQEDCDGNNTRSLLVSELSFTSVRAECH